MKVLIDGHMLKQTHGGISRVWRETIGRIAAQSRNIDFTIYLASRARAGAPVSPRIRRIIEWDLPPRAFFAGVSRWQARQVKPDIFHSTWYTEPLTASRRIVVTIHDMNHERLPAITGSTHMIDRKRACLKQADAVIAISETTKADVIEFAHVPPERITVMPLACHDVFKRPASSEEIHAFSARYRLRDPYWLYIGRRGTYKNFAVLLKAFIATAAQTNTMLVIVGGRPELETHEIELLVTHRLEHRIVLLPNISDDALRVAYAGAAAYVFPSLAEGFGLPLLEAMACGCPVIASDITPFREVADDAAIYFDPHDAEALGAAMNQALDPAIRGILTATGRKRVEVFSWDKSAAILRGVYEQLA